jgi:hypothetical protein
LVVGNKGMGAAVLAAVVLLSSCKPSAPSESGWQSSAEQAVTDMVSEVATSRLTVEQDVKGRFVGHYAVVVLTYSEEAAGKATDTVATTQPPPSERAAYKVVSTALSDAGDAVTRARIAVTDGNTSASTAVLGQLTEQLGQLRRLDDRLKAAQQ